MKTMSEIAMKAAKLLSLLPEEDQWFALEFIKKLVLAWDPDFSKVTQDEADKISTAELSGYVPEGEIDWNDLAKHTG